MARSAQKVKNLKETAKFAKHSWEEFATKTQKKVIKNVVSKAEIKVNDLIQNLAQRVLDHVGEVRMNIYRESFEKIKADLQNKVQEKVPDAILERVLSTLKKRKPEATITVEPKANLRTTERTVEAEKAADELILKAQTVAKPRKKKVVLKTAAKVKANPKIKTKVVASVGKKKKASVQTRA